MVTIPGAQLFKLVASFIASIHDSYVYSRQVAKTVRELSNLSNAELNDIGISRGDIYSIANGSVDMKRELYNDYNSI